MPTKKVEKKTPSHSVLVEEPKKADHMIESSIKRLSQQFNLLTLLIVALFMFQVYTFYQVKDMKENGGGGAVAQDSPLTDENLIAYADEIGLDKKDFEQCLSDDATVAVVKAEMDQAASLGVQGTPGFFINGRFLGGAFPIETFREIIQKELDGTATGACTDYSEELQQYCSTPENPAFKPEAVEVALGNSPRFGPKDAKVTIVEFSDFECPFCSRAYATVNQIKTEYPKDVAIVYKHLPLTNLHPHAEKAAQATVCAQNEGKFWEMHDKLFEVQGA